MGMRVLRFKIFSELKTMVNGVLNGMRVLFWAVVLLGFFIYCFGVFLRRTLGTMEPDDREARKYFQNFATLPWAMFTLFRCFTDGCSAPDGTPLQVHLAQELGLAFMAVYVLAFLFVTIGIFNLIMGIFIDNVFTASRRRSQLSRGNNALEMQNQLKDTLCNMSMRTPGVTRRKTRIEKAFDSVKNWWSKLIYSKHHFQKEARKRATTLDKKFGKMHGGINISKPTFELWLRDPYLLDLLDSLDINTSNKAELFDVLDSDQNGFLDVHELIHGLMRMRGPPQKSDSVAALLGVRHLVASVEKINSRLDAMDGAMKATRHALI